LLIGKVFIFYGIVSKFEDLGWWIYEFLNYERLFKTLLFIYAWPLFILKSIY
jgi:hypothetical protein